MNADLAPTGTDEELAAEGMSATIAMPLFFVAWIAAGLLAGLLLSRRAHDRATMLALGAGLGPILLLVVITEIAAGTASDASPLDEDRRHSS